MICGITICWPCATDGGPTAEQLEAQRREAQEAVAQMRHRPAPTKVSQRKVDQVKVGLTLALVVDKPLYIHTCK